MEAPAGSSEEQKKRETERSLLLRKMYEGLTILAIGRDLQDGYCLQFNESGYDKSYRYYDEKTAAESLSKTISDDRQLLALAQKYKDKLRHYWNFFGRFYTYYADRGELKLESLWSSLEQRLNKVHAKHEAATYAVLKAYIELRNDHDIWSACDYNRLEYRARELAGKGWKRALVALEIEGIVDKRSSGRRPGERSIPLELIPLVERVVSDWTPPPAPLKLGAEKKTTRQRERKEKWDVFICHASEDKDEVARPLAEKLRAKGLKVWYDEFTLDLGDSLARSIDLGLVGSQYGAVILSPSFFGKEWPRRELDGLTAKEVSSGKTILPIWHKVNREYVLRYSPILADKKAIPTDEGIDAVVAAVLQVIDRDKRSRKEEIETVGFVEPAEMLVSTVRAGSPFSTMRKGEPNPTIRGAPYEFVNRGPVAFRVRLPEPLGGDFMLTLFVPPEFVIAAGRDKRILLNLPKETYSVSVGINRERPYFQWWHVRALLKYPKAGMSLTDEFLEIRLSDVISPVVAGRYTVFGEGKTFLGSLFPDTWLYKFNPITVKGEVYLALTLSGTLSTSENKPLEYPGRVRAVGVSDGRPVEGCYYLFSQDRGQYTLTLPPGMYDVYACAQDHKEYKVAANISASKSMVLDLFLPDES